MIIVLINWRILPSAVDTSLSAWKARLIVGKADGLIGEFLSRVEDASFFQGITWEMESDERDGKNGWRSQDYVSYVNVGMWESTDDFVNGIGDQGGIRGSTAAARHSHAGALAARIVKSAAANVGRRCPLTIKKAR